MKQTRIVELLLSDRRVLKALRADDGVPPARVSTITRAIARNACRRRRAAVCAFAAYWEARAADAERDLGYSAGGAGAATPACGRGEREGRAAAIEWM